jgi:hypothetical protein
VANRGTDSTLVVNVKIAGLHDNSTTSGAAPLYMGDTPQPFQEGEHANAIVLVQAWLTTVANATTSSSCYVSGHVMGRRT